MRCLNVLLVAMLVSVCVPTVNAQYYNLTGPCDYNAGCANFQGNCQGNCPGSCHCGSHGLFSHVMGAFFFHPNLPPPPSHAYPFGARFVNARDAQIANGIQSQLAFYDYDFAHIGNQGSVRLSALGNQHMHKMIQLTQISKSQTLAFNFTVQPTGNTTLDDFRRQAIYQAMTNSGVPVTLDQIVVARPSPRGLTGTESEQIYSDFLDPSQFRMMQGDGNVLNSAFLGGGR